VTENPNAAAQPRAAASLSDEMAKWQTQHGTNIVKTTAAAASYQPNVVSNATNAINYSAAALTGLK
jgi:hypothetical protein